MKRAPMPALQGPRRQSKPTAIGSSGSRALADMFKALGDFDRLRIYRLFVAANAEICVCELVDAIQMPQYQVSRHLKVLKDAGLLSVRKKGTWAYYSAVGIGAERPMISDLVSESGADDASDADKRRLTERFALRAGDRCVVGFTEARKLGERDNCDGCN
ncbi:MAG TPA: metalloregulator ArsR/SmtB family transcription factor [Spirochaetia bacterium]|nr:metalloregulator ArsR/SmtB family transcription factor [Spirochaetia bacterium]